MTDERVDAAGDFGSFEDWAQSQTTSEVSEQLFEDFKAWAPCNNYDLDWKGHGELFSDTHTDAALDGFLGGYAAAMAVWKARIQKDVETN